MNLLNLRKQAKQQFKELGIDTEDADFIIAETLNVPRTELPLINELTPKQTKQILKHINERKNKKPVSKIFKRAYFYGLKFKINNKVLSPRQDSEILIETALKYIKQNKIKSVLDLCTGSGCLAIAIKKNADVMLQAADISQAALRLAKTNAKLNDVEIKFVKSNMLTKIKNKFNLIVSNPPYIPTHEINLLEDEVKKFDPILALDGGKTGLDFYKIINDTAIKNLTPDGMLILEIGNEQKDDVINMFSNFKFVECVPDYGGLNRVLVFKLNKTET